LETFSRTWLNCVMQMSGGRRGAGRPEHPLRVIAAARPRAQAPRALALAGLAPSDALAQLVLLRAAALGAV
jgi:hypothetical protein